MIRLVIADDQGLVRDGFSSILNREPDMQVVAEAADGAQAVAAVTRTRPDVALLDVRMPVMDGLQAGRRILAAPGAPRVLTLLSPTITRKLIERFILAGPATPARTQQPRELGELTPRERQVLLLIAEGLSNAEIAGRLYLSEATVKTHVNRLLAKLGLRDRVQAVVLAYETSLITPGSGPGKPA